MQYSVNANGIPSSATFRFLFPTNEVATTTSYVFAGPTLATASQNQPSAAVAIQGSLWLGSLVNASYTSGISPVGAAGTTCNVAGFNNGLTSGTGTLYLPVYAGEPIVITNSGTGATSAPTSATASNGTATNCAGTIVVSSTLGPSPSGLGIKCAPATYPSTATTCTFGLSGFGSEITAINNAQLPMILSSGVLGTDASGNVVSKAGNTLGCLDGYDHLPCTVYNGTLLSESSPTASYATVFTTNGSTGAGLYRVSGSIYATTASSTACVIGQNINAGQVSQVGANGVGLNSVTLGASAAPINASGPYTLNVGNNAAIQTGSFLISGSNTGGVWNRYVEIERIK